MPQLSRNQEPIFNEENTVTDVPRGRVSVGLHFLGDSVFADVRCGRRMARTTLHDPLDYSALIGDILQRLGFIPDVECSKMELI